MALTKPVTVTIPEDVLEAARARVEAGDADSLSAYITGALRRRIDQDQRLAEAINFVYKTFGKPDDDDVARADAFEERARERRRLRDEGNPAA